MKRGHRHRDVLAPVTGAQRLERARAAERHVIDSVSFADDEVVCICAAATTVAGWPSHLEEVGQRGAGYAAQIAARPPPRKQSGPEPRAYRPYSSERRSAQSRCMRASHARRRKELAKALREGRAVHHPPRSPWPHPVRLLDAALPDAICAVCHHRASNGAITRPDEWLT